MATNEVRAAATALAGACIASATLDKLLDKGVITLDDAREILNAAMRQVGTNSQAPGAYEANGIIGNMLAGRFTART